MVIASIDIQDGKVVQLRQGAEKMLERDDAADMAREFDRYGEVAVIDLNAAMGTGSNTELVRRLFRLAPCRCGGGIRSVEQAAELISLGAQKVIIGSRAFRTKDGSFGVNTAFLAELAAKIGRERLIVAADSRDGIISIDGWKTATGIELIAAARQVEEFAGELLCTCIEQEGTLSGTNLNAAKELRAACSCRITVAGGVSTLDEIEALAQIDCDVQLGMALYTGKINLANAFIASLNWAKAECGLLPVIAQARDGQILMTGWTDRQALAESFKRDNLCFHSRTKNRLWMKGESSGNILRLLRLRADCDRDAILATVEPAGTVCHTGDYSCFETGRRFSLDFLEEVIEERLRQADGSSYTASLSLDKIKRKVMEEAYELCTARSREETVWEAADILFHTLLLLAKQDISLDEALYELDRRHKEDRNKKKRFEQ